MIRNFCLHQTHPIKSIKFYLYDVCVCIYIYLIKCVRIHISFEFVLLAFLGNLSFNGNHNPTSYEAKFTIHTNIYIYIYTYINTLNKMHLMQQLIISNIQQLELFINQISQILTNFWINILLLLSDAFFYIIGKYITFILYYFLFSLIINIILLFSLCHCFIYMFEVWTLNYIKNRKYFIYFSKFDCSVGMNICWEFMIIGSYQN